MMRGNWPISASKRAGKLLALLLAASLTAWCVPAEDAPSVGSASSPSIPAGLIDSLRAHIEFLAGDALQGRGSGTVYEFKAAEYVAAKLQQYGVPPPPGSSHIQEIGVNMRKAAAPSVLSFRTSTADIRWTHGWEIVVPQVTAAEIAGPLQKIDARNSTELPPPQRGAFVLLTPRTGQGAPPLWRQAYAMIERGAAAVLLSKRAAERQWTARRNALPRVGPQLQAGGGALVGETTEVLLGHKAAKEVRSLPEGTRLTLQTEINVAETVRTWNVLGVLAGSDPRLREEVVLLSAHLDHVGVGKAVDGDSIYNGADDNASGVAVVLELARALQSGPRPKRTVMFAFFGSEENGGLGSTHFREHPPLPLEKIVANLQFEMLGRPDKSVGPDKLWLTGYERSDLGPTLATRGARLVADPHPEQHFFERSDNYVLARKGLVAHTISSYGLHKDYHQPSDEIAQINFDHMTRAVASLLEPVRWLANSDFRPQWVAGKKP